MNKKTLTWIIVAVVAVIAIIWIVVAVNSGNNQNGGNGGGSSEINQSDEITDTSVQGERVEGSSIIVTGIQPGAIGAKVAVKNAGDTKQSHLIKATFFDADGNEIATGEAPTTLEPGEEDEAIMPIDGEWEDYASVTYAVAD